MPNDNVLTDERRIELAIFHRILGRDGNGDATRSYGSKDDVLNLCRAIESEVLAAHPGQPEPNYLRDTGRTIEEVCGLPEPRAEVTSVQWWLAELDQHGNPKLSDGAHSERAGADKAMYLIKNLGLDNKGKRWAVARVELSEPRPSADGVNHDAVSAGRAMVDAARAGGA